MNRPGRTHPSVGAIVQSGLLAVWLGLLFTACTTRAPVPAPKLADRLPARTELLTMAGGDPDRLLLPNVPPERFRDRWLAVLDSHGPPTGARDWAWHTAQEPGWLRENLRPVTSGWLETMRREAAWGREGAIDRPGIALVTTSLRAMPTARPLVRDRGRPGCGYPFDLLQESLVGAQEPLWISHRSRSREWTFVMTSYAAGWVPSRNVALLGDTALAAIRSLPLGACIREGLAVHGPEGRFLFWTRIGMVLPLTGDGVFPGNVFAATDRDEAGTAIFRTVTIPRDAIVPVPWPATAANVTLLASRLLGQPYGWGGLHGNRDCSATVRDLLMPFGIWLPRNSRQQAGAGRVVDLSHTAPEAKAPVILNEARPWTTLLNAPGHVMLYAGQQNGTPYVFHAVWDLTSRQDGHTSRIHIGRITVTALAPAGPGSGLLEAIRSMTFLEPPRAPQ